MQMKHISLIDLYGRQVWTIWIFIAFVSFALIVRFAFVHLTIYRLTVM